MGPLNATMSSKIIYNFNNYDYNNNFIIDNFSCEDNGPAYTKSMITEQILTTMSTSTKINLSPTTVSSTLPVTNSPTTVSPKDNFTYSTTKKWETFSSSESTTEPIITSTVTSTKEVTKEISSTENIRTSYKNNDTTWSYSTNRTPVSFNMNNTEISTINPTTALTIFYKPINVTSKIYTTIKPEIVSKTLHQTTKFKAKEIWIKPSQKGESTLFEPKSKGLETHSRPKTTNNDNTISNTTPKTIIVSIIPTSIAYSTFKKVSLTTAPESKVFYRSHKTPNYKTFTTHGSRKNVTNQETSTPMSLFTIKLLQTSSTRKKSSLTSTLNPLLLKSTTKSKPSTYITTNLTTTPNTVTSSEDTLSTNSMSSFTNDINTKLNSVSRNTLTTKLFTNTTYPTAMNTIPFQISTVTKTMITTPLPTKKPKAAITKPTTLTVISTVHPSLSNQTVFIQQNISSKATTLKPTKYTLIMNALNDTNQPELNISKIYKNLTKLTANTSENSNKAVTEKTSTPEDEIFHILTEPEHITAVVGEKGEEKDTVNLVSVLSIAAGVMMAVITVAVVIVMIERCKRPPYEEVRKINEVQMRVVVENKDIQTYSRSIFHAPLPGN